MKNQNGRLQKFNRTNLFNTIRSMVDIDNSILRNDLKQYIWPRLDFLHGRRRDERYFLFEEDYVETEWKDMISVHYINTSYHFKNTVMRVHVFLNNEISNSSYGGFFTLRRINEVQIMLSFIYPNWSNVVYDNNLLYVMSYTKKVHIQGKELIMQTYPLFVQDNITVACAQADIISMTKYLHNKFDFNLLRIKTLESAYSVKKTKMFPTNGLNPIQMLQVFSFCNIPINYLTIMRNVETNNAGLYKEYVDYSIESAIPVLIGGQIKNKKGYYSKHVVQIIGHTKKSRDQYVVYDDSGFLFRNVTESDGFVKVMDWNMLYDIISHEDSFLLSPIHEKVYLTYDNIKELLRLRYQSIESLTKLESNKYSFLSKTRFLLADNRTVKNFLRKQLNNSSLLEKEIQQINKILKQNMAHYVWYCEVPLQSGYLLFIADPTYGKNTTHNIFYCEALYCDEQLSLLSFKTYYN